jgi:hydrogenase maturation protein HypF
MSSSPHDSTVERRAIAVRGIVQGVGFRPFVFNLAARLQLRGFVRNQAGSVLIEVEGDIVCLDSFLAELTHNPPPLAQIDRLTWERRPLRGESQFRIESSRDGPADAVLVAADVATCDACLAELLDPTDRRFHHAFLNCTNCGPRLTIVTGAPYDRHRSTMAGFPMCSACQGEYNDPTDRRFHAQPTACPDCGPRLRLLDSQGETASCGDPLAAVCDALRGRRIAAVKGLGGYHLACDARSETTVAELRRRKHRDEKPFAVMVPDLVTAQKVCEVSPAEEVLLHSARRPIVLLRKRPGAAIAAGVAPANPFLGVMLPYTPVHHLLFQDLGRVPLVMTSGNRSDEPIAYEDEDAVRRLVGIADIFLVHDRLIRVRCDDSVTRVVHGAELPLRRSRGYAPLPVPLPLTCPRPILAVGGQLKATFALGRGGHAVLSHHLGDLDDYSAFQAFETDVALYQQLFAVEPTVVSHDLHPDYASTHHALARRGVVLVAVQHHHAHVASCMAENGLTGPVIGVAFDGSGYGPDGAVWGGEFLIADYLGFRRAAHLRYVGLPGGDRAVREPWRMALAHAADASVPCPTVRSRVKESDVRAVERMLDRRLNSPPTSSAGRLFDAVASLASVRDRVSYEGQAAMELEWLATEIPPNGVYPFDVTLGPDKTRSEAVLVVDTRSLIAEVVADVARGADARAIARRFHSTLVEVIVSVCGRLRDRMGIGNVALSGGVFMNALLTRETTLRLATEGFQVYRHRLVPPNDGGLSLGQVAVAAAQDAARIESGGRA